MSIISIISLVLFVALGCQIPAVGSSIMSPFWKLESPMCFMSCNTIKALPDYQRTLQRYHEAFARASIRMLSYHEFLPGQTLPTQEPCEWIAVKHYGWDGDETTLLYRADNMYLVAFANKTGTWFSFIGYHGMIPGSIPIDIGTDYTELIGGWNKLGTVPLGLNSYGLAVRNFSSFDESTSDFGHGSISTIQLIIMFPESLRFFPIRQKIINGWETDVFLDEEYERQLLVSWRDICLTLIEWEKTKTWRNKRIRKKVRDYYKITDEEAALRVVDLLLQPRQDSLHVNGK